MSSPQSFAQALTQTAQGRIAANLQQAELELLLSLGEQLVAELSLDKVLSLVATAACNVVNAKTLVVPIIDPDRKTFTYAAGSGEMAAQIAGEKFDINEGTCGWVLSNQRPLLFGLGMPFDMLKDAQWQPGMASSLLVPLICRGVIIGGLSAMGKQGDGAFDEHDLIVLTLFANQASIAIDNARIFQELIAEKEKVEVTLNAIADAVISTDLDGNILYLNAVATTLCEGVESDFLHSPLLQSIRLIDEETGQALPDPVKECINLQSDVYLEGKVALVGRRGRQTSIECVVSPIHNAAGKLSGVVLALHDVSESRMLQTELMHQASHDPLTGLNNRRKFNLALDAALKNSREENRTHALLYMDLDNFKIVNDTCGHLAGDTLLREIAMLIQEQTRKTDLLARLGGDEFGLLLYDCDRNVVQRLTDDIIQKIRQYRFTSHNHEFHVGISIGVVMIDEHSPDTEQILSHADMACYAAKEQEGNQASIYDPADKDMDRRHGEMQWVPRLNGALNANRFVLFVQPIIPLQAGSGLEMHYEVLLRMQDENGALIPPGHFIPAAERYRMINDIDRWVFDQVLERMKSGLGPKGRASVSINLSGASIGNDKFRDYIINKITRASLRQKCLCFEITETSAIQNLTAVSRFITKLSAQGCQTALDDFGSGLCSFGYLKELPVDYLKIDGQLIRQVGSNDLDLGMIEAINKIGHLLGKKTVAEWVEDDLIRARLTTIGIDYGQGYALGKPAPWDEVFSADRA